MREERGAWYLLTGLVIGAVVGLLYAWLVRPIQYVDTTPATLRSDFKDQYRALIAAAYAANPDLVRARARLDLLGDQDVYRTLAEQAQRTLADGSDPNQARALGLLAVALGQPPPGNPLPAQTTPTIEPGTSLTVTLTLIPEQSGPTPAATLTGGSTMTATQSLTATVVISATQVEQSGTNVGLPSATPTPRPTRQPTATRTALPTRTATPTPGAPFVLDRQDLVCDTDLTPALLQVQALDAAGEPVPGVEVVVVWENGEEHFFTGLKPELGLGYADFRMTPGVNYSVRLASGGQPLRDLSAEECENSLGERYWGSWSLVFTQP